MSRHDSSTWFKWTDERLQYLRDHYANESNQSIADALGTNKQCIDNKAHKLRLKKDKAYTSVVHSSNVKTFCYTKDYKFPREVVEKRAKTLKEIARVERIRLKYGLHQKTKIRLINIY